MLRIHLGEINTMKHILLTGLGLAAAAAFGAGLATYAQNGLQESRFLSSVTGSASAGTAPSRALQAAKVVLHVNQNDAAIMNLALNNAQNVASHYKASGQPVTIEVVAYGPGLHMLRSDTSPIKPRLASFSLEQPEIRFSACENTQNNMSKAEGKPVPLISEAKVVPSGVVRLIELQQQSYAYVKP
jgi:uncharacterized protein